MAPLASSGSGRDSISMDSLDDLTETTFCGLIAAFERWMGALLLHDEAAAPLTAKFRVNIVFVFFSFA